MSDSRAVKDKLMIEVSKAQEGMYFFDFHEGLPGSNVIKFYEVHGKLTWFYDHPKVFHFRDVKLAFLKL